MATDLAEFVGAAVGLNLLFGVPMFAAGRSRRWSRSRSWRWSSAVTAASSWPSSPCSASCSWASSTTSRRRGVPGGIAGGLTRVRRRGQHPARRGHHRRDGHAARRLPALGADQAARRLPRRQRASAVAALPALGRLVALGVAGLINLAMLVHRRLAVPPHGTSHLRRLNRGRARRARCCWRRAPGTSPSAARAGRRRAGRGSRSSSGSRRCRARRGGNGARPQPLAPS